MSRPYGLPNPARERVATVASSGSALRIDAAISPVHEVTLTANCVITIAGSTGLTWLAGTPVLKTAAGSVDIVVLVTTVGGREVSLELRLIQDGTGSRTVTWATSGSGTAWYGSAVGAASPAGALLAYRAATTGSVYTQSATLVDADATNLAVTFTAPTSGNVLVRLTARVAIGANAGNGAIGNYASWGLREASSSIAGAVGTSIVERLTVATATTTPYRYASIAFVLTGISAGSHTYKWAHAVSNTGTDAGITAVTDAPAVMEVWSLP